MNHQSVDIPEALLTHSMGRGIVVMAGAGVSAGPPSSLPSWYELNRMIVSALGDRIDAYLNRSEYTRSVREAIDIRRSANRFPPDYQAQILEEMSGEHYFRALQALDIDLTNAGHQAIAWLAKHGVVRAVVTTNFDRLLEQALEAYGIAHEVAYEPDTYARCLQKLQGASSETSLQLLKVHGCVRDARSLIDTLKQRRLGRNVELERCLSHLLGEYYWLFAGFSAADLETEDDYLQLLPSAAQSPGFTYVQWPGAKDLSKGARMLVDVYTDKASVVVAELEPFFAALDRSIGLPERSPMKAAPEGVARDQVEAALARWAAELHPAAAINCLAGLAEANGETVAAFELLHRFWKDVIPKDRSGRDFELYRLYHGRLGMGGGLVSVVEDLQTTAGQESIQNLFRRGAAGDARALAWAGLAWLWAGQTDKAMPMVIPAGDALERDDLSPEQRVDIWLALAEFLYVLGEPEGFFHTWGYVAQVADEAGDLPRRAKLTALAALFVAEFDVGDYPTFMQQEADAVLQTVERLNDPAIAGFTNLAHGRYLTKQQDEVAAVETLNQAAELLEEAGRPPWRIFAAIEYAKALLDQKKAQEAAEVLNAVDGVVDRYQVWLVWLEEAKGQWYQAHNRVGEAHEAFERAVDYAQQMGLERRAEVLRQYLQMGPWTDSIPDVDELNPRPD